MLGEELKIAEQDPEYHFPFINSPQFLGRITRFFVCVCVITPERVSCIISLTGLLEDKTP